MKSNVLREIIRILRYGYGPQTPYQSRWNFRKSILQKGLKHIVSGDFMGLIAAVQRLASTGRFLLLPPQETIFHATIENFRDTLLPLNQLSIEPIAGNIGLWSTGNDPYLQTSGLNLESGQNYWLVMVIGVPLVTRLQVFYGRRNQTCSQEDSTTIDVHSGYWQIVLPIPEPETVSRLRLDPGEAPGMYILEKFQIIIPSDNQKTLPQQLPVDHAEPPFAQARESRSYEKRQNRWLALNEWNDTCTDYVERRIGAAIARLPKISVVVPTYNQDTRLLGKMIGSVRDQIYRNWELCIADDRSTSTASINLLRQYAELDARIKIVWRETNGGISRATNSAAAVAQGKFLAFMDSDDALTPDALAEIALHLGDHPDVDILYSDEDKIDNDGNRYDLYFKQDYSPELLLVTNVFNHLTVIRKSLFEELGGLRNEFDLCQDIDLLLRATDEPREVAHVPLVLYHWRAVPGSGAARGDSKDGIFESIQKVLEDTCRRRGYNAKVFIPKWARDIGNVLTGLEFPNDGPSVTILIWTKVRSRLSKECLDSLEKTTYSNYSILIVDNQSAEPKPLRHLRGQRRKAPSLSNRDTDLNHAFLINEAILKVNSDFILFLNDDLRVQSPQWLSQMMGYAQIEAVGAVGAKLLSPEGIITHAGFVHGVHGGVFPDCALKGQLDEHLAYLLLNKIPRNCSAITAECMLTPRQLFVDLGGFDAHHFPQKYYDVDYCYRLLQKGYRSVLCADAVMIGPKSPILRQSHHNSEQDLAYLEKYHSLKDPYYNPNLDPRPVPRFEIRPCKILTGNTKTFRTLFYTCNLNREEDSYALFELVRCLRNRNVVSPMIVSPIEGPMRYIYEDAGIPVKVMPSSVGDNHGPESWLDQFSRFIRCEEVELVFINSAMNWPIVKALKRLRKPCLWSIRENDCFSGQFGLLTVVPQMPEVFSIPYQVIFGSFSGQNSWSLFDSHYNFSVIHNFLEWDRTVTGLATPSRSEARSSLGLDNDCVATLLTGTVCERKGQLDLVHAVRSLSQETLKMTHYFIVGDSECDYSNRMHQLIRSSTPLVQEAITVVPITGDVHRYYSACDIGVCTSMSECFPRVTLEYMGHGLPIVTTLANGIAEQVFPGVNALTYKPGDIQTLAKHLTVLAADEALRQRFAVNSRRVFSALNDFDDTVSKYSEVIREACLSTLSYQEGPEHP